jgi:uncharacterized Zn-binding protein involved in type VI secretion
MPGISRVGMDTAGNTIVSSNFSNVKVNGSAVAHVGSAIANHCSGSNCPDQHTAPTMATGSASVRIGGIPVCRAGDSASCGHSATGSGNVRAG